MQGSGDKSDRQPTNLLNFTIIRDLIIETVKRAAVIDQACSVCIKSTLQEPCRNTQSHGANTT